MSDLLLRLSLLILIGIATGLMIWFGRRFIDVQRQQALQTAPLDASALIVETKEPLSSSSQSRVRILAFTSADCRQCSQFQAPALKRVQEKHRELVNVINIDAPTSQQLVQTYRILTVPSTVLLDVTGNACFINYGFTNTSRLQQQVNEILSRK